MTDAPYVAGDILRITTEVTVSQVDSDGEVYFEGDFVEGSFYGSQVDEHAVRVEFVKKVERPFRPGDILRVADGKSELTFTLLAKRRENTFDYLAGNALRSSGLFPPNDYTVIGRVGELVS